jgi:arsenite oxidase small subunit
MAEPRCQVPAWRSDFPVDWDEDTRSSRRMFTQICAGSSAALFLANVWILLKSAWRKPQIFPKTRLLGIGDIPVGGSKVVAYPSPSDPVVVVRIETDRYVAYSQKCTHLSCPVRYEPSQKVLACACHMGLFRIEDGSVLAGPPTRALPRVRLSIVGQDVVAEEVIPA